MGFLCRVFGHGQPIVKTQNGFEDYRCPRCKTLLQHKPAKGRI